MLCVVASTSRATGTLFRLFPHINLCGRWGRTLHRMSENYFRCLLFVRSFVRFVRSEYVFDDGNNIIIAFREHNDGTDRQVKNDVSWFWSGCSNTMFVWIIISSGYGKCSERNNVIICFNAVRHLSVKCKVYRHKCAWCIWFTLCDIPLTIIGWNLQIWRFYLRKTGRILFPIELSTINK